jgi:hypothetical protein
MSEEQNSTSITCGGDAKMITMNARCVKCGAMIMVVLPVFPERLKYAVAIAGMMQRPGVVILCDDCTPKTEVTA